MSVGQNVGLKLNIQKAKVMTSSPIISWQIDGGKWKQWQTLFSWARKSLQMATAATTLKRCLLLGRKAMTKQDSILKSTDITLLTKIHIFQATLFPAVMYRCESWTIKMWELDQLSAKELKLLNCGAGEDSWESLGQKGDPNSQSKRKPTLNIHWRDWRWSWSSKTWATWC